MPYPSDLNFELEPSGTLLLEPETSGESDRILRYDPLTGSKTTALAYPGAPRGPVTDGEVILFTLADGSLMKYAEGTATVVVPGTTATRLLPHAGYEANDGWIAFQKPNASDVRQLYLQSPDGTAKQASHFNAEATIHSLDSSGTLLLANSKKLYQYQHGMDKLHLIAGDAGVVRRINSQLYYLLGDTIFAVQFQTPGDTEAPTWPQGDVLSSSQATFNGVKLNWQPATDEEGVVKYLLYQNNKPLSTLEGSVNSYEAQGLSPNTSYLFTLVAVDAAGNQSIEKSVSVTTVKPTTKPETLLYRFDGTILDLDQSYIVWKKAGDRVLWLFNRIDKSQVKVYDAAGSDRTITNAALTAEGIVYTLDSSGSTKTYIWKNGTVTEYSEGQTPYETRGIPEGMVMYTINGTTYLYGREGELLCTFSGPGKLEYREHIFSEPSGNPYRFDAWYRVYGGSLYSVRM
ncbi:fibronectin type III domain-containing protein [Cohnella ginsengisoli]|uniref:Fibronectin type III domain-containing protein n=1 Tax=Cohnella ginsengisoli TaxID=425004 RepID=A0A9X4KLZ8_9BACL|nr:fibronectin type III domain-containing protein [Cohnella ginsengisoli]MDG0793854.1 fibronectin type III domain-containing protein [Cohnella ginsengisoli]